VFASERLDGVAAARRQPVGGPCGRALFAWLPVLQRPGVGRFGSAELLRVSTLNSARVVSGLTPLHEAKGLRLTAARMPCPEHDVCPSARKHSAVNKAAGRLGWSRGGIHPLIHGCLDRSCTSTHALLSQQHENGPRQAYWDGSHSKQPSLARSPGSIDTRQAPHGGTSKAASNAPKQGAGLATGS
jgi:hypothetical protein